MDGIIDDPLKANQLKEMGEECERKCGGKKAIRIPITDN